MQKFLLNAYIVNISDNNILVCAGAFFDANFNIH